MKYKLPELTSEEKAQPYAKYYYKKLPAPFIDPETIKDPMDTKNVVMNLNDILNLDYAEVENGYCQPQEGGGYVAITTKVPGVTLEMYKWWKNWRETGDDLRYKIWYPGSHTRYAGNKEIDWEWIQEDIGNGLDDIYIVNSVKPEDMFDMDLYERSPFDFIHAGNGISRPVNGDPAIPPFPMFVAHFLRTIPEGIEIRSRFWQGYHCKNKRLINYLSPEQKAPIHVMYGLAEHCLTEYANIRELIPALYEEFADK